MPSEKASRRYKIFTGHKPVEFEVITVKTPQEWISIAQAKVICYDSDKLNGGGTGRKESFKHRFGSNVTLYTDPDGKFLLIAGPGLKSISRGIVG